MKAQLRAVSLTASAIAALVLSLGLAPASAGNGHGHGHSAQVPAVQPGDLLECADLAGFEYAAAVIAGSMASSRRPSAASAAVRAGCRWAWQ